MKSPNFSLLNAHCVSKVCYTNFAVSAISRSMGVGFILHNIYDEVHHGVTLCSFFQFYLYIAA